MKELLNKLKSFDYIIIIYCLLTGIYIIFGYKQLENIWIHLGLRILIISISFILIHYHDYNKIIKFVRDFYPLILLGFFYSETGYYNQLLFNPFDSYLINIEEFIFGFQPSIEFSKQIPHAWFSEIMHFGYFSYYLLIFGIPLLFYLKTPDKFERSMFIIICSFCIYYTVFFLFPSIGPQFYFDISKTQVPEGFLFDKIMQIIIATAETPTGAFPSSHVGLTIILIILSWKSLKQLLPLILTLSVILIMSTVYIKAHYVIDVLAGLISGILFYKFSNYLFTHFTSKQIN